MGELVTRTLNTRVGVDLTQRRHLRGRVDILLPGFVRLPILQDVLWEVLRHVVRVTRVKPNLHVVFAEQFLVAIFGRLRTRVHIKQLNHFGVVQREDLVFCVCANDGNKILPILAVGMVLRNIIM